MNLEGNFKLSLTRNAKTSCTCESYWVLRRNRDSNCNKSFDRESPVFSAFFTSLTERKCLLSQLFVWGVNAAIRKTFGRVAGVFAAP